MTRVFRSQVLLVAPSGRWGKEAKTVKKLMERVLRAEKRSLGCEVNLVTAKEMRTINRTTRGKDEPTTVLSFEAPPHFPHPGFRPGVRYLGEVYLAPLVIRERGEELPRFALHGLLHLLGYTHAGKRDTMKMERREERILKDVGIHEDR